MQNYSFNSVKESLLKLISFEWIEPYYRVLFFSFITFVIYLKSDYLDIPIYWDETIYFIPSLFHKGFSVFAPENYFSYEWHGHPPLFQIQHYFISLFHSDLIFTAHLTALINFIFFLASFFYILNKNFGWRVAFFTPLIFTMYPHVIAQASMFHPNFLMIACGILSVQYYLDKKWYLYVITATASILTRESAIAFSFVIIIHSIYQFKRYNFKRSNFTFLLIPVIVLMIFFTYNKYIDGHIFTHPYFKTRTEQGFSFFNFLDHDYYSVWESLKDATWSTWGYISIVLTTASLFLSIYRKNINLKKFDFIFIISSLCFLAFYTLYADTIVRDYLFFTVVFVTYNIYFFDKIFNKTIYTILFSASILHSSMAYHHGVIGVDTSLRENRLKPLLLKEISTFIDQRYTDKTKVGTGWPLYNLLRDPLYGHSTKSYQTSFDKEKQDILVNTILNGGFDRDYRPSAKDWKRVYFKNITFPEVPYYNIKMEIYERINLSKDLINE